MRTESNGSVIAIEVKDAQARYPLTIDPTWSLLVEFEAPDGAAGDQFGTSVAASGANVAVGAPDHEVGTHADQGAAYVFTPSGGSSSPAELTATGGSAGDEFGSAVAMSGSLLAVGAPNHTVGSNAEQGAVYVFSFDGSDWSQSAALTASDGGPGDEFGTSVAISGSTIVVGSPQHTVGSNGDQGAVYVLTPNSGGWSQTELTSSDGAAGDEFGSSVSIAGSEIAVGAPDKTDDGVSDVGAGYVFAQTGSTWSQSAGALLWPWIIYQGLYGGTYFGASVAISGSILLVGGPGINIWAPEPDGAVAEFTRGPTGWSSPGSPPILGSVIIPYTTYYLGASVALSGTTAVIGGPDLSDLGGEAGAVSLPFSGEYELTTNPAPDGAHDDEFGSSVAASGPMVVVGAPNATVGSNTGQGAVYSYSAGLSVAPASGTATATHLASKNSTSCQHNITQIDPVDCASGDFYHTSTDVSIPGYGPSLDLTRTYNSSEAATETMFGYGWSSSYDSHLAVNEDGSVTITEADGSQVTAIPDGSDFDVPSWADSTLVQNEDGSYTFVRQGTQTFTYNSSGQLTSIADANGATTSLAYASGKLHTVTDPSGRSLTFAYGENGFVSAVTDPMSRETQYSYDDSGNLTSVTNPLGNVTSFTYDDNHLMLTMTMPNGQSGELDAGDHYTNTYDGSGRVLTQTDPKGQETTYAYSGDNFSGSGGTTTITDPDGVVTTEGYLDGQLLSSVVGSAMSVYSYDQSTFGQTLAEDPDGDPTVSAYDDNGNRTSATNALGDSSTYSYNSLNEQTCAAEPLAASPCSSLTPPTAVSPGGTITPPSSAPPKYVTYTLYDTDGNELYQTTGDYAPGSGTASQSRTTYDLYNGNSVTLGGTSESCTTSAPSAELPCATIDPNGVVTQLTYDSAGDLTSKSTLDGNSGAEKAKTTYAYDTDGEQTSTVAPDGNLSGANAGNYTTASAYNADGEKTSVTLGGGSGHTVVPRITTYTYDGDGNRTATTQSASPQLIGTAAGHNSSSTLTLSLPGGTRAGDEAVLSTTTSPPGQTPPSYSANDIYTLAGTGATGTSGDSGQASDSKLDDPEGVAFDASGDEYIADATNNRIQEIAATTHTQWGITMTAGDVYTVAGSALGTSGNTGDGGAATSAKLAGPAVLAFDASGNLYIDDYDNGVVREVAATTHSQWGQSMTANDIYTVVGNTNWGDSANGTAMTSAEFEGITGLAFDSAGDLYVSDSGNNRVLEVPVSSGTKWGSISETANEIFVVAGTGTAGDTGDGGVATSAKLHNPYGIAFDSGGDLYITDASNDRIQEVAATSASQWGQSMTANDAYTVADTSSGSGTNYANGAAMGTIALAFPSGVALDASGNLYIDDGGDSRVLEVPAASGTDRGVSMTADDSYTIAGDLWAGSGYSGDGGPATSALLSNEGGIALDSSAALLISDNGNNAVRLVAAGTSVPPSYSANDIYTLAGTGATGTSGDSGQASDSKLDDPEGVAFDASGDEYIADATNNRIQEIAATTHTQWGITMTAGDVYTVAGSALGTSGNTGDGGAATSAKLAGPAVLAFDASGNLYIDDYDNGVVREVAATTHSQWGQSMTANDIYTVVGNTNWGDSANGTAMTSAEFEGITGLAFDSAGDLYVSDSGNNRVLEVPVSSGTKWGSISETANEIFVVAGTGTAGDTGDGGVATSAKLHNPYGIAFDSGGDLYITDASNDRIQEVAATSASQWGQSMTANDAYTVADTSSGSGTNYANGAAMGTIALAFPSGVALDASGNLYIDDGGDSRVLEVPAASGTDRGVSMTATTPTRSPATSGLVRATAGTGAQRPVRSYRTKAVSPSTPPLTFSSPIMATTRCAWLPRGPAVPKP